jgi:hypothetical protein
MAQVVEHLPSKLTGFKPQHQEGRREGGKEEKEEGKKEGRMEEVDGQRTVQIIIECVFVLVKI